MSADPVYVYDRLPAYPPWTLHYSPLEVPQDDVLPQGCWGSQMWYDTHLIKKTNKKTLTQSFVYLSYSNFYIFDNTNKITFQISSFNDKKIMSLI